MSKIDDKKTSTKLSEEFIEDDSDKRVIVFVVIAILIIMITIVGILIGCQKKEVVTPDDEQDIVIPVEKDEDEEKDEEKLVDRIVVKKVTSTSNSSKPTTGGEENKSVYKVVYLYDDLMSYYVSDVNEGDTAEKYIPKGYSSCKYYTTAEFKEEFDFNTKIKSDTEIYLECEIIEYTIIYDRATTNPKSYTVNDTDTELSDIDSTKIFIGWYSDSAFTNKVTALTNSIVEFANENNEIYLYAKEVDDVTVEYYGFSGKDHADVLDVDGAKTYEVQGPSNNDNICASGTNFLGWTLEEFGKVINANPGDTINVKKDTTYYAVCGAIKVIYTSEGKAVEEIGYTENDLSDYNLPTAEELDMEVPTYFVKVDIPTGTSKKVVANEKTQIDYDEIKLEDVSGKEGTGYTAAVDDNVEELEKEFAGWSKTVTDPFDGTVEEVKLPEEFVPDADITLNAIWEEQTLEFSET